MADVSSNAGRGRHRTTYVDLIGEVLQKRQVLNMNVDEAKGVSEDRSRWSSVVFA